MPLFKRLEERALMRLDRVDQPVGTGFATGKPTATSQEETAADFIKFFKNFQEIFGIKNFKIYVTGESYAGRYVPYISGAMLDQKDCEYYDLKGESPP
jgi:carboxypeptidase D